MEREHFYGLGEFFALKKRQKLISHHLQRMLLLGTKNMQGFTTLLVLHLENAWPQVYASGYIVGDTRGASAKDLFVLTLLPICDL